MFNENSGGSSTAFGRVTHYDSTERTTFVLTKTRATVDPILAIGALTGCLAGCARPADTPADTSQQFKGKIFGGLDPDEVDGFLQQVSQEMERLVRENNDMKEQLRKASVELDEMNTREKALRETMLAAQRITEDMKSNAQKEATLIISEAELKAERILADAENKLAQLGSQIQDLRREKLQFETALKSLLDTHYKMLTLNEV